MSLVKISGNASGTGTLTIAAPNTNSNYTLTLPTNTGTILTNATTTGFPAGSVLQLVQNTYSTTTTISNATYTDTGLTATITPTSASSKILVLSTQLLGYSATLFYKFGGYRLLRGSTAIYEPSPLSGGRPYYPGIYLGGSSTNDLSFSFFVTLSYMDSPATTSSTTYKTQFDTFDSVGSINAQAGSRPSVMILMEIAA